MNNKIRFTKDNIVNTIANLIAQTYSLMWFAVKGIIKSKCKNTGHYCLRNSRMKIMETIFKHIDNKNGFQ